MCNSVESGLILGEKTDRHPNHPGGRLLVQFDCNRLGNFYMIIIISVKFILTLLKQTIFPIFLVYAQSL